LKATGIIRKIDELGRIVIPKQMRAKMDIKDYDPIEIYVEDDKIILKKSENYCSFCGGVDRLCEYKDKKICEDCLNEIKSL
jgi:transcriptional pleiotropic regulator of transition state genes